MVVEFTNIAAIGSLIMQYSDAEVEALPRFDTQKIADQLKAQIERALASAAVYSEAKKAFLVNNAFLSRAFAPVTSAMMNEFVAALFKDGEISLSVSILSVKQNDNAEFKNYATAVSAGLYADTSGSGAFATFTLYTNEAGHARLRQYDKVTLSGQFVRMESSVASTHRFTMTK